MKNKRKFGSNREAAKKFAEQVNGRVFCISLEDLAGYMVEWQTTEEIEDTKMEIKIGDYVRTPRFLEVRINEIFKNENEMRQAGYTEPTHYINDDWEIGGKPLDMYHMKFAACKKAK